MKSSDEHDLLIEALCRVVEAIPPGQVTTYGEIAKILEVGPRQVGRLLHEVGGGAPWWRVVNVAGELPPHLVEKGERKWRQEGTPLSGSGSAVAMRQARIDARGLRSLAAKELRSLWGDYAAEKIPGT